MAAEAKILIKGENQLSPAIKSAKSDMTGFETAAKKVGDTLKSAFAITAIIASLKKLGDSAKQCFSDFTTAERSYKQLALALKDTSAYNQAVKTIETLSRQTLQSKGDIESMVTELAALGKSADEIDRISTAAVALSNVTGKDLNSSMTIMLNTLSGTTTQLKRLGVDTSNLTTEELEQGAAIDLVIEKLGDYSTAMAEADSSQHLTNIKNTWGDIKQAVGGVIDYNFAGWFAKIDEGLSNSYGNIVNVIQYVGAVINNFPEVFKLALNTVWELIKRTFEWDSLKTIFTTVVKNLGVLIGAAIQAIFVSIPKLVIQVGKGILNYVAYLAVNIKNSIVQAVEDILNAILLNSKNWPKWLKKLLGMEEDEGVFNFNVDTSSADKLKKQADEAFEGVGGIIGEAVENAVDAYKEINSNNKDAVNSMYGDIIDGFKEDVNAIVAPTLAEIKTYSEASDQTELLNGLATVGDTAADAAEVITDAADTLSEAVEELTLAEKGSNLVAQLSGYSDEVAKQLKLEDLSNNIAQVTQMMTDLDADGQGNSTVYSQLGLILSGLNAAKNAIINPQVEDTAETFEAVNDVVRQYSSLLDYGVTQLEKEEKVRKILEDELKNGNLTIEERAKLETMLANQEQKILDLNNEQIQAQQNNINSIKEWRESIKAANEEALNPFKTTMKSIFGQGGRFSKSYWSTETYTDDYGNEHTAQKYNQGGSEQALWGELGSVVSDLLSEFSGLVDAIISGCWWLAIIIEIVKGFVEAFKPFMDQVLGPVKDLLQQFGAALADASVMEELIKIVQMLLPIIKSVMNIITPFISILTALTSIATETLMPVIKAFAYVLISITGTIEWVVSWFKYWVDSLCNWLASIDIAGWRPFGGLQRTATKPSNYGEFMSGKYASIDAGYDTTYDTSAATSVTNASYTGATNVTINIYQQAPVVGDGGMKQFAQMIRDTFEELDYFGVSA